MHTTTPAPHTPTPPATAKHNNTPRLRFAEFQEAVPTHPLSGIAEIVNEKIRVEAISSSSYVSTENLLPEFAGMAATGNLPPVISVTRFQPKDILISNIRPYLKKVWQADIHGGASNDVLVVRAKSHVDANYLAALLRSDHFIDYVMRGAKGVKMPRGEISMIREFPIPCPSDAEQQKIAACLTSLDTLITAQTQKLDTLKTHKKGLMQQLFPRAGETTPRLRFAEFRGEWEQMPLCKVCNVLQGYGFPEALQGEIDGKYPFCKVSDISKAVAENGGNLVSAANYIDDEVLLKLKAKTIPNNSTVFAKIGEALRLNRRAYVRKECLIDNNVTGLKAIDEVADDYFIYLLSQMIDLNNYCGGAVPSVNKATLEEIPVVIPTLEEQQKIAACLSSLDELITAQAQKVAALQTHKKGLLQQLFPRAGETTPRLRFAEFRGEWGQEKLAELITTITPPAKLQTSDYLAQGSFPIIDQSQEAICGWTNDADAVVNESLPLIVFGDHTCAIKFVNEPFAQGADGIKIIKAKTTIAIEYLFQSINHNPLTMGDYKRHFSDLKERAVFFPDIKSGEQQKIAACLSSLDELITAQAQKVAALQTHKKGLMQQLFPAHDEASA